MNLHRGLFLGSLAANVALLLIAGPHWSSPTEDLRRPTAQHEALQTASPERAVEIDPATWQMLDPPTLEELAERLRSHGFPPGVVRAMVTAQVRERFAPRFQAIVNAAAAVPYWRGEASSLAADPRLERERRALEREVSEIVMQTLGPGVDELSEPARQAFRRQYGDLSPEKIVEMQRIQSDYVDLMAEVRSAARGVMLTEDAAKLALLEKEMRADLEQLLTPAELESIDLHSSPVAARLRTTLSPFRPSEEEFRALFQIQQAIDSRFGTASGGLSAEQRRLREEAKRQAAFQIEAALGPERYAEYKLKTDPAWNTTNHVVRQLGLPATTTSQVMVVQQDITERAQAVRSNASLTPQQRQAQLQALGSEAASRLSPVLGERGLTAYQRQGGSWLRSLQPPRQN